MDTEQSITVANVRCPACANLTLIGFTPDGQIWVCCLECQYVDPVENVLTIYLNQQKSDAATTA